MAFYECIDKVKPFITTETVFDTVITFNDIYGNIPLVTCDSLISGYQEGSGTASPDNVRPLHAFSSGTLTANGNTYTFTFGQTIYQGSIDWKRGVVTCTKVYREFDGSENWNISSTGNNYYLEIGINSMVADTIECDKFENIHRTPTPDFIGIYNTNRYIQIRPSTASLDIPTWKNWLQQNGLQVAYELATPIEIPLGGINLLTQQGQNNIFCDTGDTTVEYIKIV